MRLNLMVAAVAWILVGLPASAGVLMSVDGETESEVLVSISMDESDQGLAIGLHGIAQGLQLPEVFEMESGTKAAATQEASTFLVLVGSGEPFMPILPIDSSGPTLLRGAWRKTGENWSLSLTSVDLIEPGGDQFAINTVPVNEMPQTAETTMVPIGLEAYPNPGWDRVFFSIGGSVESVVSIGVYDAQGRLVRDLRTAQRPAELHRQPLVWDGCDAAGNHVGAGVYFARVCYDGGAGASCKLTLIR